MLRLAAVSFDSKGAEYVTGSSGWDSQSKNRNSEEIKSIKKSITN